MMCFDSILVRLKGNPTHIKGVRYEFRFHTGSIKSQKVYWWRRRIYQFRFHTGSIKSRIFHRWRYMHKLSFDSILVRLKVFCIEDAFCREQMFRFHTGSIKRCPLHPSGPSLWMCFDSILVRLKVIRQDWHRAIYQCFDSILVRLKARRFNLPSNLTTPLFRFHTGSIKSRCSISRVRWCLPSFDSILVRLKVNS